MSSPGPSSSSASRNAPREVDPPRRRLFDACMTRLLPVVAALALLGAGCGTAEDDANRAVAASKSEATGSSRFALTGEQGSGADPIAIWCTGEADYVPKRVLLSCDYGAQARMEIVTAGNVTYMRGYVFGFA